MKKRLVNGANIVAWIGGLFIILGAILVIATKVPVRIYVEDTFTVTSDYFNVSIINAAKGGVSPEVNLYLGELKYGKEAFEWGKSDQLIVALCGLLIGLVLVGFSFIPRQKKGVRVLLIIFGAILSIVPIFFGAYFLSINGNFLNFKDPYYNKLIESGTKADEALRIANTYNSQFSYGLPGTMKAGGAFLIIGAIVSFVSSFLKKQKKSKAA